MKTMILALAFVAMASMVAVASARGLAGHEETIELLQQHALPGEAGKQVIVLKVSYAPGKSSAAHAHPGPVFAYVLDGELESQLEGGPRVTYKAGESWYEPPGARHLVSRNASKTRPATLLVWMVKGDRQAPVRPLSKDRP